jgi:hypothetical protein
VLIQKFQDQRPVAPLLKINWSKTKKNQPEGTERDTKEATEREQARIEER